MNVVTLNNNHLGKIPSKAAKADKLKDLIIRISICKELYESIASQIILNFF